MDKLLSKHKFPNKKPKLEYIGYHFMSYANKRLVSKIIAPDIKIILQLGVWSGSSVQYILGSTTGTNVIAVDLWEKTKKDIPEDIKKKLDKSKLYEHFIVNTWNYNDRIYPIKIDGRKAIKYIKDMEIKPDLILIDMGHKYESIMSDLENICKYFPETYVIGNDILNDKVGDDIKHFIRDKCDIFSIEVDENSYALIPKQKQLDKTPLHNLTYNKIEPNNLSDKKLIIITFYENTDLGKSNAKKWYNEFNKIRHNIKVQTYFYILFEQNNNFNVGQMLNIGYEISKNNDANFIFHANNFIPDKDLIKYYSNDPFNPILFDNHTLMISNRDLIRLNGFSNEESNYENLWKSTLIRISNNNMIIDQPKYGKFVKLFENNMEKLIKYQNRKDKSLVFRNNNWNNDGLNNIQYGVYKYKKIKIYDYIYYINVGNELIWNLSKSINSNIFNIIPYKNKKFKNDFELILKTIDVIRQYQKNKYSEYLQKYYQTNNNKFMNLEDKLNTNTIWRMSLYKYINSKNTLYIQYKFNSNTSNLKYINDVKSKFDTSKSKIDLYLINDLEANIKFLDKIDNFTIFECDLTSLVKKNKNKYDLIYVNYAGHNLYSLYNFDNKFISKNIIFLYNNILQLIKNNLIYNGDVHLWFFFPFNQSILNYLCLFSELFNLNLCNFLLDIKCWFRILYKGFDTNKMNKINNFLKSNEISLNINIENILIRCKEINLLYQNIKDIVLI